ncbi:hypothetical protein BDZ89DRAFT_1145469 [Hymenopellis radicata]|nr:hypothetical protein BDZ89DRAFT_1145469 [Hymenopellis radicata]
MTLPFLLHLFTSTSAPLSVSCTAAASLAIAGGCKHFALCHHHHSNGILLCHHSWTASTIITHPTIITGIIIVANTTIIAIAHLVSLPELLDCPRHISAFNEVQDGLDMNFVPSRSASPSLFKDLTATLHLDTLQPDEVHLRPLGCFLGPWLRARLAAVSMTAATDDSNHCADFGRRRLLVDDWAEDARRGNEDVRHGDEDLSDDG